MFTRLAWFCLLFCVLPGSGAITARAQTLIPPRYRNLVMESGGILGIAHGGALLELEQRRVLAGLTLDGASGRRPLAPYDITAFNTYMGALYTMALENLNPVQPGDWPRTISIDFLNFSPKIKRISDAEKNS